MGKKCWRAVKCYDFYDKLKSLLIFFSPGGLHLSVATAVRSYLLSLFFFLKFMLAVWESELESDDVLDDWIEGVLSCKSTSCRCRLQEIQWNVLLRQHRAPYRLHATRAPVRLKCKSETGTCMHHLCQGLLLLLFVNLVFFNFGHWSPKS